MKSSCSKQQIKSDIFCGSLLTQADDGVSGAHFRRPDFQRMIEDIEAGKINLVAVKDAYVKNRLNYY